jgi:beta-galactosidase
VWLKSSGCSRSARLYVGGREAGYHNGFTAPFRFDLTDIVEPGKENTFVILVDNSTGVPGVRPLNEWDPRRPVGSFTNLEEWGGNYGHVQLETSGLTWVDNVHVRTSIGPPQASFILALRSRRPVGRVRIRIEPWKGKGRTYSRDREVEISSGGEATTTLSVPMPEAELWSVEHPTLYVAHIEVLSGTIPLDCVQEERFELRDLAIREGKILLNGRPFTWWASEKMAWNPSPARRRFRSTRIVDADKSRNRMVSIFGVSIPAFLWRNSSKLLTSWDSCSTPNSPWQSQTIFLLPYLEFLWHEQEEEFVASRNHLSFISSALGNELYPMPGKEEELSATFEKLYDTAKRLNPDAFAIATDGFDFPPGDFFSAAAGWVPARRPSATNLAAGCARYRTFPWCRDSRAPSSPLG